MSIQDLGSLGEFIAAIATIATLVYLAVQIRQNTDTVRNQSETTVSQQLADWCGQVVTTPGLSALYDKAARDPGNLDNEERALFLWMIAQLFLIYEGHYHLYKKGFIVQSAWGAKENLMLGLLQNPVVRDWWDSRVSPMSPEFFDYLEPKIALYRGTWQHETIG